MKSVGDAVLTLTAGEKSVEVTAAELGTSFTDMNVIQKAMDVCRSGNLIKRYKDKKDLENGNVVIDMVLDVDEDVIATLLEEKADQLDQEAVDSTLTRENGEFQIVEGAQGIEVNIEKSVEDIENYISGEWNGTDGSIELTAEIV